LSVNQYIGPLWLFRICGTTADIGEPFGFSGTYPNATISQHMTVARHQNDVTALAPRWMGKESYPVMSERAL
jgi:hypothetical protein